MKNALYTNTVLFTGLLLSLDSAIGSKSSEQESVQMDAHKNIIVNAIASQDLTQLVSAIRLAGLEQVLKTKGPFTVFAPVNDAFQSLLKSTSESFIDAENSAKLSQLLSYHIVCGQWDFYAMSTAIEKGNGIAKIETIGGNFISVMKNGRDRFLLRDERGFFTNISVCDIQQSNGIIHMVDRVLLPHV